MAALEKLEERATGRLKRRMGITAVLGPSFNWTERKPQTSGRKGKRPRPLNNHFERKKEELEIRLGYQGFSSTRGKR